MYYENLLHDLSQNSEFPLQGTVYMPEGVKFTEAAVYGSVDGRDLTADIITRAATPLEPRPALVSLHGGSWRAGTPSQFHFHSAYLAAKYGFFCMCVDYRLSGEAPFPAALQDAKCAVRWIRAHALELNIDPERIAIIGGSAGAHLSSMVATTAGVAEYEGNGGSQGFASHVNLAILVNGEFDMWDLVKKESLNKAMHAFMGGTPEEIPQRYDELSSINEQIEVVRSEYGLEDDEDWPQGEGPLEYQALISQFDAVLDQKLVEAFIEFGAPEIGTEFTANQDEHYRKLEYGLHTYLGEESSDVEEPLSIITLIETYEHDAELVFESGAYYAACALLGAALEAQLLGKCQREQDQVKRVISRLRPEQKPKRKNPLEWSLANLLNVCDAAGWLPSLEGRETLHNLYDWGIIINRMRNTLHPGNHLRVVPFHMLGESDYLDAASIYLLIKNSLND